MGFVARTALLVQDGLAVPASLLLVVAFETKVRYPGRQQVPLVAGVCVVADVTPFFQCVMLEPAFSDLRVAIGTLRCRHRWFNVRIVALIALGGSDRCVYHLPLGLGAMACAATGTFLHHDEQLGLQGAVRIVASAALRRQEHVPVPPTFHLSVAVGAQFRNSCEEDVLDIGSVGVMAVAAPFRGRLVIVPSVHDPPVAVAAKCSGYRRLSVGIVTASAPVGAHRCVWKFLEDDIHMAGGTRSPSDRIGEQAASFGRVRIVAPGAVLTHQYLPMHTCGHLVVALDTKVSETLDEQHRFRTGVGHMTGAAPILNRFVDHRSRHEIRVALEAGEGGHGRRGVGVVAFRATALLQG
jgi:hypothetical protein